MTTTSVSQSLRTLGNSDLHLTPIGFGAWAIGGGNWEFAWGPQDDNESIAAIHRALDLGINWIDTAAIYGLGHSEEIVGRALKSASHKPLVFTKCSMRWRADRTIYRSLKATSLAEELDASLRRLGVDAIDLYQIHWPDPDERNRRGLGNPGQISGAGKGALDRGVELHRGADEARPENCAHHQPAAALFHAAPRHRRRDPALCASQRHRSHQLLADGFRPAYRQDDSRARRRASRRRLAPALGRVQANRA